MSQNNNRWLSLVILLSAPLLSVIDVFIINVAIPSIRKGVHATDAETQLVIAGYLLGYAVFLITGGRMGDFFGRKKIFIAGMLSFTLMSCLCGLSTTASLLCVARCFQGVTAAFMVPQTISYIQILFRDAADRSKAVGLFGVTLGVASIIGQSMGGWLSELHGWIDGWRLIFFINVPIGFLASWAAVRYIEETPFNKKLKFDYAGVLLLTAALVALIYPIIQGREAGWPLWSIAAIAASIFLFRAFFIHQNRKLERGGDPLMHTNLFNYRDFNFALAAVLFYFMQYSSYLLTSTVYFQEGLGMRSFTVGQLFVFMGLGFMVCSLLAVRLVTRYGKIVMMCGAAIMITGLVLQAIFLKVPSWPIMALLLTINGCGAGLLTPSLLNAALKSIPLHFAGAASGVYSTFQQTASALGVSIIGGIFYFFAETQRHEPSLSAIYYGAFRCSIIAQIVCLVLVGAAISFMPDWKRSAVSQPAVLAE
jgi:EmrB/QacA subfamily drug resistance transporter